MLKDYYKGKKVLVTGGTGLIGSALVRQLTELNSEVFSNNSKMYNLTDAKKVEELLTIEKWDIIFHTAAKSEGAKSMSDNPKSLITPNVIMTSLLLDKAQELGIKEFIYISSNTVNFPEIYPGIAHMKKFCEELCEFYRRKYNMKITIIRPCNTYGPGDKFDERGHFIPMLIKRALESPERLVVWGSGSNIKDMIYVDDLAEGILETHITSPQKPICIGTNNPATIKEIAESISYLILGRKDLRFDSEKPDIVQHKMPEVDIIKNRTSLLEGINKTIEWYKLQKLRTI